VTVIGNAEVEITASADKFSRSIDTELDGASRKATGAAAKIGAAIAGAFAVGKIIDVARQSIAAASDLSESQSKANVVFGKSVDVVNKYADSSARSMGLSKQAYLESTSTLGNLLLSVGQVPAKAAQMSTSMVKLAGDLASFNNVSPEEAIEALRSGLVGETEPLKRFGVNMNEATLKAKAMQLGLSDGKGVLDANAKSQAAYALIMEQTKTAQGDFARTSDGLANRQRILAAQMENLKAKLGQYLLPAVLAVTTALTNGLRPVFEWLITTGKRAWEWVETSGVLDELRARVDAVRDALEPVVKAIGRWVAANPFPVIAAGVAVLTVALFALLVPLVATAASAVIAAAPFIALGLAIAAVAAGVVWAYQHVDIFRTAIDAVVSAIGPLIDGVMMFVNALRTGFTEDEGTWFENLALKIREVAGVVIDFLVVAWGVFVNDVVPVVVTAAQTVWAVLGVVAGFITGTVVPAVVALADWFTTYVVPAIVNFADIFAAIGERIAQVVRVVWPFVQEYVTVVLNIVRGVIEAFVAVVSFLWDHFGGTITGIIAAAFGFIWHTVENVLGIVKGVVEGVLQFLAGLFHVIASLIRGDWGGMWDGIKTMAEGAAHALTAIVTGIFGWMRDAVGRLVLDLLGVAADLPRRILGALGDLAGKFLDVGASIIRGIIRGIVDNIGAVANAILDHLPGGGVVRGAIKGLPGFDEGGWVNGPPGAPQLAVVHGGEYVLSRAMLSNLSNRVGTTSPVARATPIVGVLQVVVQAPPGMTDEDARRAGYAAADGAAAALEERRLAVQSRSL
jgi:phage-related protein